MSTNTVSKDKQYVEREYVARGPFSEIYKARYFYSNGADSISNLHNGQIVALKITEPDGEIAPHNSRKELRLLKRLTAERHESQGGNGKDAALGSKYILEILDSYNTISFEDSLVLVLPYLPYHLDQVIAAYRKPVMKLFDSHFSGGSGVHGDDNRLGSSYDWINKVPTEFSKQITYELGSALNFLHQRGIIHRDIKPQNILFASTGKDVCEVSTPKAGNYPSLQLADFGITWIPPDNEDSEPPEQKITDVGSGPYRSPEVLFGIKNYDTSLDMWSLGCLIAQLYSKDTTPLFLNENSRISDIALISSIFETIGTPTIESWKDAKEVESFKHMTAGVTKQDLKYVKGTPLKRNLIPLAPKIVGQEILPNLLVYQGSERMSAEKLIMLQYFKELRAKDESF